MPLGHKRGFWRTRFPEGAWRLAFLKKNLEKPSPGPSSEHLNIRLWPFRKSFVCNGLWVYVFFPGLAGEVLRLAKLDRIIFSTF